MWTGVLLGIGIMLAFGGTPVPDAEHFCQARRSQILMLLLDRDFLFRCRIFLMISPCIQFMEGGTGGDPRMDPTMEDWIDAKWYKARPMILLRSLSSISLIGFFHVRSIRARSPAATEEAAAAAAEEEARGPPTAAIGRRPCSGARTAARGTGRAGAAPRKPRTCENVGRRQVQRLACLLHLVATSTAMYVRVNANGVSL